MKFRKLLVASTVTMLAAVSAPASGALTYQGVTFEVASGGSFLRLTISDALNGGTGNWADITHLASFQIGIDGLTGASVVNPDGWASNSSELNAKGCEGGSSTYHVCFEASDPLSLDNPTDSLTFNIALDGVDPNSVDGVHLKVAFIDQDTYDTYFAAGSASPNGGWKKTGDLLSMNVPVPEPEIYAMMAVGMGIMGWAARRKKQKQRAA